ncbi:hypothetical protein DAPPUDRAFT_320499 [Daphnia pulex]|uniref:Uncharacterized protein n=1 Tax=Daphnia pulex TaxID=6669 RepID=E9GQ04_DAPPU|nr:hypothetical protein DAPPUDRAFT_320499 [Daphnia pulex]|eukprot:EFX78501.1 hypothetical protein DAPPUDRAFT_320499 [Daphnia pulex]
MHVLKSVNGLTKSRTIHGVLYAPNIGINLVSVGAITNNGTEIHFTGSQALIVRNGAIEMTTERVGRTLYLLNISVVTNDVASIARPIESSIQEWHQRLALTSAIEPLLGWQKVGLWTTSICNRGLNLHWHVAMSARSEK